MTTYFKLVKGATKIKSAPPKQKYLDPILLGTSNEEDFYEIVKGLDSRINSFDDKGGFQRCCIAVLL